MTKLNKCSPENKSVSPKNLKICLVTFPTSFPGIIAAFIILKYSFHISCRAFDALAAAETAADFRLSFLFNPARLNRMVQNQALYNALGVDDMINVLMNKTWHAPRLKALPGLILQQNEQLLLTYLLSVSTNDELSFAAHAAITKATNDIEKLTRKQLLTAPASAQGYLLLTLERIKNRLDAKPYMPEQMPPGAPIGCGEE